MTDWNRRSLLSTILGVAGASCFGVSLPRAQANTTRRRHLINLHGKGGMDFAWSLNPMREADVLGLTAEEKNDMFYGKWGNLQGLSYNPEAAGNAVRYADSDLMRWDNAWLGPVMKSWSQADLEKVFIWRGLSVPGSHGKGNVYIQNGHQSPYALCFSVIIADHLAKMDYARPLHYVQLSSNPIDLFTQLLTYKGAYAPINIPDKDIFQILSKPVANDPFDVKLYPERTDKLKEVMRLLVNSENQYSLKGLDALNNRFLLSFNEAQKLMGEDYVSNPAYGFQAMVDDYKQGGLKAIDDAFSNEPSIAMTLKNHYYMHQGGGVDPSQISRILHEAVTTRRDIRYRLEVYAEKLAITEFLITHDLAAVVDLQVPGSDFHTTNAHDLLEGILAFSMIQKLINKLNSKTIAGEGSPTLLDRTTLVYATEFSRTIARGTEPPIHAKDPGTNHGYTTNVVLAGYGVNKGKVRGHHSTGPDGPFAAINNKFAKPIALDPTTGQPVSGGRVFSQYSILPTLTSIFGASIPSQQVTGEEPFQAAIKKEDN